MIPAYRTDTSPQYHVAANSPDALGGAQVPAWSSALKHSDGVKAGKGNPAASGGPQWGGVVTRETTNGNKLHLRSEAGTLLTPREIGVVQDAWETVQERINVASRRIGQINDPEVASAVRTVFGKGYGPSERRHLNGVLGTLREGMTNLSVDICRSNGNSPCAGATNMAPGRQGNGQKKLPGAKREGLSTGNIILRRPLKKDAIERVLLREVILKADRITDAARFDWTHFHDTGRVVYNKQIVGDPFCNGDSIAAFTILASAKSQARPFGPMGAPPPDLF